MDPFGFGRIIADKWDILMMSPGAFGAVLGFGFFLGLAITRAFLNERLTRQQMRIADLEKVLDGKLSASFLPPPPRKRSKQMSFGLVLIFVGIGAVVVGAINIASDRSTPPSKQPPSVEPPAAAPSNTKITDLYSQLDATKSELEAARKELADIRLAPTAERDIVQNRLHFKLDQAKIDKDDFDKAIAAVRASAENALNATKAWAINPPQGVSANLPLRNEHTWEEQIRGLQKLCDRVFPGERIVVLPREPTVKELTYGAPDDSEMKDPDSKARYRILNFKKVQVEWTLKQIEQKMNSEIDNLTSQIREMR